MLSCFGVCLYLHFFFVVYLCLYGNVCILMDGDGSDGDADGLLPGTLDDHLCDERGCCMGTIMSRG